MTTVLIYQFYKMNTMIPTIYRYIALQLWIKVADFATLPIYHFKKNVNEICMYHIYY